jgi:hypothetical protein
MIGIVKFVFLIITYFLIYQLLLRRKECFGTKDKALSERNGVAEKTILQCARDDMYNIWKKM